MTKKQKLELTWIGKGERPRLEPRILIEDPELSYHAKARVSEGDIFDNRLIMGDNLLALKALEQEFAGKVKCIFIDPPYNTGSAFEHYDDGLEHSQWLSLMQPRLELLHRLLADDGSIWVTIDDNEAHYLKVLMDEVFGRQNFVANIVWRSADSSNNDAKTISLDHNHLIVYRKSDAWSVIPLARSDENNAHYKNPDNDPRGPWFAGNLSSPKPRPNLRYDVISPKGTVIKPPSNGWRWKKDTLDQMIQSGEIVFSADGSRVIKKTYLADQGGIAPSTMWDDIEKTGHNRQAKYELKKLFPEMETSELFATPKPEKLMKLILEIATRRDDIILDSFLGSATTAAVAHKMSRRWIGIEMGDHAISFCAPRLRKVVDGEQGGISEAVGWKGGGGFRFYHLAPSLLEKDRWDNWVITQTYNPTMLAEAVCKLMGFAFAPSDQHYWLHGKSSETDFIYVTTQCLTHEQLRAISEEVGDGRSLLVCCKAFSSTNLEAFPNLTVKKIPQTVLRRCEWGRDDYSLNVANLPPTLEEVVEAPKPAKASKGKAKAAEPSLFDGKED